MTLKIRFIKSFLTITNSNEEEVVNLNFNLRFEKSILHSGISYNVNYIFREINSNKVLQTSVKPSIESPKSFEKLVLSFREIFSSLIGD